jgi:hypothetical protein
MRLASGNEFAKSQASSLGIKCNYYYYHYIFERAHVTPRSPLFFPHDNSLPFSERKDLEAEMERAHGKPRGILLSSVPIITEQSHAAQRGKLDMYACMCAGCLSFRRHARHNHARRKIPGRVMKHLRSPG